MKKDFLEEIKDPLALVREGQVVAANEAFRLLFHLEGLPVELRRLFEHYPADYGLFETRGKRLDGSLFEAEAVLLPFQDGQKQLLVRDVSQRRATEKMWLQAERLTAMGKLAGEIAHEINNPLGGILLYANLLREDLPEASPLLLHVDKIIKLATRCRIIAKALLNFGRPEDTLEEWVDLNQVVRDMFSLIEDHRLFKAVTVRWELAEALPFVQGNRSQLEQLTLNLIINAGEALAGQGHLVLRTYYQSREEVVVLEVEDDGPGIPPEIREKIFEPFFTTKKGGKGTGLGLAICHGIVKRHGGTIEVESQPGRTLFRVKLPKIHYE